MALEEAIEIIWERHMDCEDYRFQFDDYPDGYDFEFDQAILMAAQALEEIQKYREIGTVEECREAVEKQKLKKPVKDKYNHNCCPNCGWIAYAGKSCSRMTAPGHRKYLWCAHCKEIKNMVQIEKI